MKKFFKGVGIVLLCFVGVFTCAGIYLSVKSAEYDSTAVPYINRVLPELSLWDASIARKYMAKEVVDEVSDEELEKLFRWFSKLGELKSMEPPEFTRVMSNATVSTGSQTIVTYTILTHYENGDANIRMQLLEVGDDFEVYEFNVNSIALID